MSGIACSGTGGVLPFRQRPNAPRTCFSMRAASTSPAMARIALFGLNQALCHFCRSARSIPSTVLFDTGQPLTWSSPHSALSKCASAMVPGSSRMDFTPARSWSRTSPISFAGKLGRVTTAGSRSRQTPRSRDSTVHEAYTASSVAVAFSVPPTKSIRWAISSAPRRPAPRVSICAVNSARPRLSRGSVCQPERTARSMLTTGRLRSSTTSTSRPFGSVKRLTSGSSSRAAGLGGGASMRSVRPSHGSFAVCEEAAEVALPKGAEAVPGDSGEGDFPPQPSPSATARQRRRRITGLPSAESSPG